MLAVKRKCADLGAVGPKVEETTKAGRNPKLSTAWWEQRTLFKLLGRRIVLMSVPCFRTMGNVPLERKAQNAKRKAPPKRSLKLGVRCVVLGGGNEKETK